MTRCIDTSFLIGSNFSVVIPDMENFSATVQQASIPSTTIGESLAPSTLLDFTLPGEKITYNQLIMSFPVQQNMANYAEIYNWMMSIAGPESPENRVDYSEYQRDGSIILKNHSGKNTCEIVFNNMFPIDLSDIPLDVGGVEDGDPILSTVTFRYEYMSFKPVLEV